MRSEVRSLRRDVQRLTELLEQKRRRQDAATRNEPAHDNSAVLRDGVLVFYASWCGPCQKLLDVVRPLTERDEPIQLIDIEGNPDLVKRFKVDRIPTTVVVHNGKEQSRRAGLLSETEFRRLMNTKSAAERKSALGKQRERAPSSENSSPSAMSPLTGAWRILEALVDGKARPDRDKGQGRVRFENGKMIVFLPNAEEWERRRRAYQYEIAPDQVIHVIDPDSEPGENRLLGRYQLEKNRLRLAVNIGSDMTTPPLSAVSEVPEPDVVYYVLERIDETVDLDGKITSRERPNGGLVVQTYAVADLVIPPPPLFGADDSRPEEGATETLETRPAVLTNDHLINMITGTVVPDSWEEVGGPGSIHFYETTLSLVVRQTPDIHKQIARTA